MPMAATLLLLLPLLLSPPLLVPPPPLLLLPPSWGWGIVSPSSAATISPIWRKSPRKSPRTRMPSQMRPNTLSALLARSS